MIAIIDNHRAYTSHCIYFVEVPPQHATVFVAAFAGNTGPRRDDDDVCLSPDYLPYLLGTLEHVEWRHGKAMPLTEFISDMNDYHHANNCDGDTDRAFPCTCWVGKLPRS